MIGLGPTTSINKEDRKESSKTYVEQTKLLITLASTFIVAPAVLYKDFGDFNRGLLVFIESAFIISVIFGYVAIGAVAGTQYSGDYNIFRRAVRYSSLIQLGLYLLGMVSFIIGFLGQSDAKKSEPQKVENIVKFNHSDTLQVKVVENLRTKEISLPKPKLETKENLQKKIVKPPHSETSN